MKFLTAIAISLGLTASPTLLSAQQADGPFLRGNWFVRNCDSREWELACAAFILGYYQGSQTRVKTVCLPEGVDTGQLITVGLNYMKQNPQRGHIVGMALLDEAWEQAFPC